MVYDMIWFNAKNGQYYNHPYHTKTNGINAQMFCRQCTCIHSNIKAMTLPANFNQDYLSCKMQNGCLVHYYLETRKRVIANSADQDQMPHYVASDLGLHCFLTGFSVKSRIKAIK